MLHNAQTDIYVVGHGDGVQKPGKEDDLNLFRIQCSGSVLVKLRRKIYRNGKDEKAIIILSMVDAGRG